MTNCSEKDTEVTKEKKLNQSWSGRFNQPLDEFISSFAASVQFDKRLYKEDISGSIAHAEMLAQVEILTEIECSLIVDGLKSIEEDIEKGTFVWSNELEDVHMNIEAALTRRVGDVGKKLHTGRSRNDQVATDLRLFVRQEIDCIATIINNIQAALLDVAEREAETVMPGFTHMQAAQPISFGHQLLAWFEMLDRDYQRLMDCRKRANLSPLGAAALAGTTFPIDRHYTSELLGFSAPTANSLDSVSDRDFAIELAATASILMTHLSRFSEELVLWASAQFDFIQLPDRFCTGSSIMPQKKNPDVPELVRGKTGRITGHLISLLTLMKAQPLAYNKDNQEDKEPLFDLIDTVKDCLSIYQAMIPAIECNRENMRNAALKGHSTATDLAEYLVKQGVAFRDAHETVGKAVALAIKQKKELSELSLGEFKGLFSGLGKEVFEILTLEGSLNARNHLGGTAPEQVRKSIEIARKKLAQR